MAVQVSLLRAASRDGIPLVCHLSNWRQYSVSNQDFLLHDAQCLYEERAMVRHL